jgi:D-glycero-alpha-D-manno-heptose-7-phosphate kinase
LVISRTPLRVSFVGGGTDIPAFADEHGGAVVSTTIDKYVYVVVTERFENTIRASYTKTEIVERLADLQHELIRECLRAAGLERKIEVVTIADVPAHGTGLGSSSAVTVGLLNALFAYRGIEKSADDLAADASRIEIDVLGKPIGRQDAYASAHGGLQVLRFGKRGEVRRDPLVLPSGEQRRLERNLLMFYTGKQRDAAAVLAEVGEQIAGNDATTATLGRMRESALDLAQALTAGGTADLVGAALGENWKLKRSLHASVSSPEVDRAYESALAAGALGGKILGAGGGGFLLVYAPGDRHSDVRESLRELRELPFEFDSEGSRIVFAGR